MFRYTAIDTVTDQELEVELTPSGDEIRLEVGDSNAVLSKQQMGELGIFLYAMSDGIDEDSICELLDGYFGERYRPELAKRLRDLADMVE